MQTTDKTEKKKKTQHDQLRKQTIKNWEEVVGLVESEQPSSPRQTSFVSVLCELNTKRVCVCVCAHTIKPCMVGVWWEGINIGLAGG